MRRLKSILKNIEEKLGIHREVGVVFGFNSCKDEAENKKVKRELIEKYKTEHPTESVKYCFFTNSFGTLADKASGKFISSHAR